MYLADINYMLLCASLLVTHWLLKQKSVEVIDSATELHVKKLSEKQFTNMSDNNFTISITICTVPLCWT